MRKILLLCSVILVGVLMTSAIDKKEASAQVVKSMNTQIDESAVLC